jgi:hypothetical protein
MSSFIWVAVLSPKIGERGEGGREIAEIAVIAALREIGDPNKAWGEAAARLWHRRTEMTIIIQVE